MLSRNILNHNLLPSSPLPNVSYYIVRLEYIQGDLNSSTKFRMAVSPKRNNVDMILAPNSAYPQYFTKINFQLILISCYVFTWGDPDVDGRIILRWILASQEGLCSME